MTQDQFNLFMVGLLRKAIKLAGLGNIEKYFWEFTALFKKSARPIQPQHGRTVWESN